MGTKKYTLPPHQLAPKGSIAQLVEYHTEDVSVGSIPTQVLRFFPLKRILEPVL